MQRACVTIATICSDERKWPQHANTQIKWLMRKTCVKIVTLIFIIKLKGKGEELRVRAKIDDI